MAPEPDILLLDEPTNHLDLPAIEWLETEIASLKSALVIVSHDRTFLGGLTRATVWLDRGRTRRLDKGFSAFEAWRDIELEEEEKNRHKLDRQIVREEHWVRYGVTARRKRNVGRLERLAGLRQQKRDARRVTGEVKMSVSEADVSGKMVVEAKEISKAYDGRTLVARFLDPHHPRRPHRRRRRQRHRQDDAPQDADRRAYARQRQGPPRLQHRAREPRPAPRKALTRTRRSRKR